MKKAVFFLLGLGFVVALFAHSGGTDAFGCHTDSRTGLRHCH